MKQILSLLSGKELFLSTIKIIILFLTILIGWYILNQTFIAEYIKNYASIEDKINKYPVSGSTLFIFLGGILTTFGFPRIILSTLAGFIFGFLYGTIFALAGTIAGCILTYYYARFMGRSFIKRILPQRLKNFEPLLKKNSFSITLMIRFFPIGNNTLTNLLGGVSSVKQLPYFLASLIGYLPQTVIFTLLGSGVKTGSPLKAFLSIALFLISILIMLCIARNLKKNQTL
jgi:uncharacterized membrane protein YdjX (TVP38/TMEM64 family)